MSGESSSFQGTSHNLVQFDGEPEYESLPPILKAKAVSFEKLFEWLAIRELFALRLTCKRMKRVVDYYIQTNYPTTLRKLLILKEEELQYFSDNEINGFELVNTIYIRPTIAHIDGLKQILAHVEIVDNVTSVEMLRSVLALCPRLTHLKIYSHDISRFLINSRELLQRCRKNLVHIEIYTDRSRDMDCSGLDVILQENRNIKELAISANIIWHNREWILNSKNKVDLLHVTDSMPIPIPVCDRYDQDDLHQLCNLLNKLHEQGFYRRLHITLNPICSRSPNLINSLRALEAIYGYSPSPLYDSPSLIDLKELEICATNLQYLKLPNYQKVDILERIAANHPNLERLIIYGDNFSVINPFIHRCSKLIEIAIAITTRRIYKVNVPCMAALNDERAKLKNAKKTTIFIDEPSFLETKFKQNINYSFIELKRFESWKPSRPFLIFP